MAEHAAVCRDCDWEKPAPNREVAEHAKRSHEEWTGHTVSIERVGG